MGRPLDVVKRRWPTFSVAANIFRRMGDDDHGHIIEPRKPLESPDAATDVIRHQFIAPTRVLNFVPRIDHEHANAIPKHRIDCLLVDAGLRDGLYRHPLVEAIRLAAHNVDRIDIAVCTHQDADHARGFVTFPEAWYAAGGSIGEFWLPGRWAAALPAALTNPRELIRQLVQGASEAQRHIRENSERDGAQIPLTREFAARPSYILRDLADAYQSAAIEAQDQPSEQANRENVFERTAVSLGINLEVADLVLRVIEEADLTVATLFDQARSHLRRPPLFQTSLTAIATRTQFLVALDVPSVIVAIAQTALRRKIPIRWFDFGLFEAGRKPHGGRKSLLDPHSPDDALNFDAACAIQI
jgi:Metallo-beta-lactamase superfamily